MHVSEPTVYLLSLCLGVPSLLSSYFVLLCVPRLCHSLPCCGVTHRFAWQRKDGFNQILYSDQLYQYHVALGGGGGVAGGGGPFSVPPLPQAHWWCGHKLRPNHTHPLHVKFFLGENPAFLYCLMLLYLWLFLWFLSVLKNLPPFNSEPSSLASKVSVWLWRWSQHFKIHGV